MFRFAVLFALTLAACSAPSRPQFPTPTPKKPISAAPTPAPVQPRRAPWKPAKVIADAVDVPAQTVTVARGDTLSQIGERTGSSVQAIAQANAILPPYTIEVGQVLKIPAGRYHTVKTGETGITIARAYGADWEQVVSTNALKAPYTLRVGQRLRLPTKAQVREMTLAERAAAFTLDIDDLITGSEPAATEAAAAAHPAGETAPPQAAAALPAAPAFNGRFMAPVDGRLISRFGAKSGGLYNDGINLRAPAGTPIRAAASGVVAYAGNAVEGFGNLVLLKHEGGWVTAYAHAEDLLVIRGDTVRQGDPIARVGKTGSVDEPQLHFEIRQGKKPVDPLPHLPGVG
ncbi:peptidoglycan DD-metalloendopeptidase family protein [Sphingosinicella soli]|uniref:Murein DD-endopeptidase MepM/ murein hydrolase activator NlpD n=1 Tax=Sphingosinicella soli TaxID=333708 RepID=A0A7W7B3Q0_9SPHN|nr:peptidoglycan DD-metalloendopeptidase family protein [Sphingosinicella soli]MBB4633344.1 murein DD-endopeptidase MepM/ murein hydrolase activator NlpD [Sphingosinicella soli]